MRYFIFVLLFPLLIFSDPWGKDADLVKKPQKSTNSNCKTPIVGALSEKLIAFHQQVISPADGPR